MRTGSIALAALLLSASVSAGQDTTVYRPGGGVSPPILIKEVKPTYTPEAKAARIQGVVQTEAVVRPDGTVSDVKVVRSLDKEFGLDDQAVTAAKQWLFKPGLKGGKPVAVRVTIELSFTLPGK